MISPLDPPLFVWLFSLFESFFSLFCAFFFPFLSLLVALVVYFFFYSLALYISFASFAFFPSSLPSSLLPSSLPSSLHLYLFKICCRNYFFSFSLSILLPLSALFERLAPYCIVSTLRREPQKLLVNLTALFPVLLSRWYGAHRQVGSRWELCKFWEHRHKNKAKRQKGRLARWQPPLSVKNED